MIVQQTGLVEVLSGGILGREKKCKVRKAKNNKTPIVLCSGNWKF